MVKYWEMRTLLLIDETPAAALDNLSVGQESQYLMPWR
jgi:hypothetical protein